jgi:hypothetical protein
MRAACATLVLIVGMVAIASATMAIDVARCGQVVGRGQVGVLMTDLDCGHQWGTCRSCATLDESWCPVIQPPISCSGPADCPDPVVNKCDGSESVWSVGVYLVPPARLFLNGHTIRATQIGVYGARPDGTAGSASISVVGPGTITATREAVRGYTVKLTDGVVLHDNLYGVTVSRAKLADVDASRNTIGVSAFDQIRAKRLISDDNRFLGLLSYSGRVRLISSHLTGNAVKDIVSEKLPRVSDTTCEESSALGESNDPGIYEPTGTPWGICSTD